MTNRPVPVTMYFLRHGDKELGDFPNLALGHQDQPLSRRGRQQARRIAKLFRRAPIRAIYVSQYIRTLQTAQPLARTLRLVPVRDTRLNEIDMGELERMSAEELQSAYPETWAALQRRDRDFRWPGGETGAEAQTRIVSFLEEHGRDPGDALVVTHDGIIRLLLCHLLGAPVHRRFGLRVGTGGCMEIRRAEGEAMWTVIRFNQQAGWMGKGW